MREKLFGFQEDALSDLHKRINSANSMLLSDAEEQVIISFSAPTGSGKTIVMTALFEDIFFGSAETQGDPDAIIVWLSDMPELNEQSQYSYHRLCFRQRNLGVRQYLLSEYTEARQ